jgi:hypothetical protein
MSAVDKRIKALVRNGILEEYILFIDSNLISTK